MKRAIIRDPILSWKFIHVYNYEEKIRFQKIHCYSINVHLHLF